MNPSTAKDLFFDALELSNEERGPFLDEACRGDAELRESVERLLHAHEAAREAEALGGLTPTAAGEAILYADSTEGPGDTIGRYKLLQLIGEGGFGSVWMAEQKEPVKRRVALKVIKLGMDTKQVIARFEAERQALAMMEHPNIARALDAGATDMGRPYFVMELVKGVPILEYCDTEKLDTDDRVQLFTLVCHAIQHAHQKGIIHRDIKPGNVLVTLHDGVPVPKVIDFGIAKATHQELTTKTLFTEHRQMIGTPAYMSPEQAEMSGLDIDTRSDIYSLGVLLYELLTGTTPFRVRELQEMGLLEMMRVIREEEPEKPSTRLVALGDTAQRAAELRRLSDPDELRLALRGDLDWIVMRCLEKDRTRRYDSATGIADDLQRHLTGQPVIAAPPSASYRLRKFVRRNRGPVAAAIGIAAVFVLGIVGTTWGLLWALDERERAVAAEDATARELTRATEVKSILTDMLSGVSPSEARGADTTLMRQILDGTAQRLEEGEVEDEHIAAELHSVIGDTYQLLGLYEEAEQHLPVSAELHERLLGAAHPDTLRAKMRLGILKRAQGKLEEAQQLVEPALQLARKHLGRRDHLTLALSNNLGNLYWQQRELEKAEELYLQVVESYDELFGVEDSRTLLAHGNLAMLYRHQGRVDESERLALETLETSRRVLGPDSPSVFRQMNSLGNLYTRTKRYEEALEITEESLAGNRRVLGDEHPDTLAVLHNLAGILMRMNRADEAEEILVQVVEARSRVLGPMHAQTLGSMRSLTNIHGQSQRPDAIRGVYEEHRSALIEQLAHPGASQTAARSALLRLARAYEDLGEEPKAHAMRRRVVQHDLGFADGESPTARQLHRAAELLLDTEFEDLRSAPRAARLAQRACDAEEAAGGSRLGAYFATLARAQHLTGGSRRAVETQRRALELLEEAGDADDLARQQEALVEYERASADAKR